MKDSKFNPEDLIGGELELLILLMEECGEVIQAASKCIRCIEYVHPNTGVSNKQQLKTEMNDLRIIMLELNAYMYQDTGNNKEVVEMTKAKYEKLSKWTNVFSYK